MYKPKKGDKVTHKVHGEGVVLQVSGSGLLEAKFRAGCKYVESRSVYSTPRAEISSAPVEWRARDQDLRNKLENLIAGEKFDEAERLYDTEGQRWVRDEYASLVREARKKKQERQRQEKLRLRSQITLLLDTDKQAEAERLSTASLSEWWSDEDYALARREASFVASFEKLRATDSMSELDHLFINKSDDIEMTMDDFVQLKAPLVARAAEAISLPLDQEQQHACSRPETRLLITARAGSGKTRVLCAKTILAIHSEKLSPNQVMILAFNKDAAEEARERIRGVDGLGEYDNARTFHSLAYRLATPRGSLLFDEGKTVDEKKQGRFVQRLLTDLLNPAFKDKMIEFFRAELKELERIGRDLPPEDYRVFRRSLSLITLGDDRVKSLGEKIIGDFLFEHGIEYRYEQTWEWKSSILGGTAYRPDFSLISNGKDFIIEHWAIDPDDQKASLPIHWTTTTEVYRRQIIKKRQFWGQRNVCLIETNSSMLSRGREAFESALRRLLHNAGVRCEKLSAEEIRGRVFQQDYVLTRMASLFLQFIQRCKKKGWSPDFVARRIGQNPSLSHRNQIFYELALRVYRRYEGALLEQGRFDFEDVLAAATKSVEDGGSAHRIHLGEGHMLPISDLRWLMLDEHQDFSELYYRLIRALWKANPSLKVVAVGDDWQAINGWAGADLKYFSRFEEYFGNRLPAVISTNYRSDQKIVEAGNRLMMGLGTPSRRSRDEMGSVQKIRIDDNRYWIEFRSGDEFNAARAADAIFLSASTGGTAPSAAVLRQARALKACAEIVNRHSDDGIMFLSRNRRVYDLDLEAFRVRLLQICVVQFGEDRKALENSIVIETVHTSKGREAACVVVLDVTEKKFPTVHSDNLLFEIFGTTTKSTLEEERRLFYVAITRARHHLYLLTENDSESPYLAELTHEPCIVDMPKHREIPSVGPIAQRIIDREHRRKS
jgi:DNA helicase-4